VRCCFGPTCFCRVRSLFLSFGSIASMQTAILPAESHPRHSEKRERERLEEWSQIRFFVFINLSLLFSVVSQFASKSKYCYGVFSFTTMAPLSYARLLFVADSLRASPLWYRGDFLPHYALVEVFHAAFAVWLVLVVTARKTELIFFWKFLISFCFERCCSRRYACARVCSLVHVRNR